MLLLAVFKKGIFFRKTYLVFIEKTNFWNFWGSLLLQSPSAANLLLLAILKEARFSRKTRIFWKKPNFCTLWVNLLCLSVSMETFHPFTFSCYNKTYYSVSKSSSFFQLFRNFQYFEKFSYYSRILQQVFYL